MRGQNFQDTKFLGTQTYQGPKKLIGLNEIGDHFRYISPFIIIVMIVALVIAFETSAMRNIVCGPTRQLSSFRSVGKYYCITGYGVSGPGIQNQKDFCIKINIRKLLNFEYWSNVEPQLIFLIFHEKNLKTNVNQMLG